MNKSVGAILLLVSLCSWATAMSQRRVTPVTPTVKTAVAKQQEEDAEQQKARLRETVDSHGHIVLVDTVTGLEYHDTTSINITHMQYPLLYRVSAGINIWDMAMRCLGQQYGIASVWGELSLHNRYFPRFEIGLGTASVTPEAGNYTFRVPVAPFFKIGGAYNIFYNSNPDYRMLIGANYGITSFNYSVDNVIIDDAYWGETTTIGIPRQHCVAGYFELMVGVRVKIVSHLSMGWNFMFHKILHESRAPYGEPMYFPGYGKRIGSMTASLSVLWDFSLPTRGADT